MLWHSPNTGGMQSLLDKTWTRPVPWNSEVSFPWLCFSHLKKKKEKKKIASWAPLVSELFPFLVKVQIPAGVPTHRQHPSSEAAVPHALPSSRDKINNLPNVGFWLFTLLAFRAWSSGPKRVWFVQKTPICFFFPLGSFLFWGYRKGVGVAWKIQGAPSIPHIFQGWAAAILGVLLEILENAILLLKNHTAAGTRPLPPHHASTLKAK